MKKIQTAKEFLTESKYFRLPTPNGVSPDVWVWEGEIRGKDGYLVYRTRDEFTIVLNPNDKVMPLESLEDL